MYLATLLQKGAESPSISGRGKNYILHHTWPALKNEWKIFLHLPVLMNKMCAELEKQVGDAPLPPPPPFLYGLKLNGRV